MKKIKTIVLSLALAVSFTLNAQIAISTDGSNADASAILEVKSTDRGLLPPRMTEAQMNVINNPVFGLMVMCTDCNPKGPYYFDGSNWLNFSEAQTDMGETDVYNPITNKIWMDRNLGASRVATSSTDYLAYGYLYQWGRGSDGHQIINWTSSTTTDGTEQANETSTLSNTDAPGHSNFITNSNNPSDWRSPINDNLWQGVNGINNPCPNGYRLPTGAEWEDERQSWTSNDAAGAIDSPLKLPLAGYRVGTQGSLNRIGSKGYYHASTVLINNSRALSFDSNDANLSSGFRGNGTPVRCIKD